MASAEILGVDLAQHHLQRAVVELEDVLEDEEQRAHLVGDVLVLLLEVVEDVALGGAVGGVQDRGQRARRRRRPRTRAGAPSRASRSITRATSLTTSGDVWPIVAMRIGDVGLQLGREQLHHLRGEVGRGAGRRTIATVCGCSLRRKAAIWSGGVLRRNSNGVVSMMTESRFRISPARAAPTRLLEHLAGEAQAALGDVAAGVRQGDHLLHHLRGVLGIDGGRARHLDGELLDHLVGQVPEHLGGAARAQRDEQDGRLAPAVQPRVLLVHPLLHLEGDVLGLVAGRSPRLPSA